MNEYYCVKNITIKIKYYYLNNLIFDKICRDYCSNFRFLLLILKIRYHSLINHNFSH